MLMRLQLLLLAVILPLGLAGPDYGQGQEPLPVFRLVEITPDQLGDEIRRQQALVAMPRSEFEELLRQVRTNSQLLANRPRLLESHYLARLEPETDSLVGEGLWTLHNPNSGPTVFRIQPWNLALRGQASLDGQPALLGELPDQTSALLLNAGGRKQVRFAWSARSLSQPDSLRYILQIPPAPVTVLDLEVPADRLVECPGHRPVPLADNRWRIVLPSSTSELEVLIRPSDFPHRTRLLTADLTSTWTLRPLFAQVRYVLDIRSLHRPLKDVVVQLPERLEILDVIRLPPTAPPLACSRPDPQTLVLAVSEPAQRHLTIEVQARLPLSPDGAFSFPVPVVKDAWLEPENLRIRFLQGMNPAGWDLADFRLAEPPALERDAAEVYEVIRLVQTLPGSLSARRPSVQAVDSPAPLDVRQQVCWMPALTGSWMDVATRWRIGNKPVFRLAFQVPDKAQVQRAEVTGTTTDVTWFLEPPRHLVAEFREPLPPRSSVKTRLTLRLDSQDPRQVHEVPSVVPLEAQVLESGLAVFSQTATSRGRFRLTDTEAVPTTAFSLNLFDGLEHPWAGLGSRPDGFWVQRGRIVTGRLEEVPADQRRPAERAADSERKPADDIQLPKNDSETNSNQNDKSGHSILRFTDIVVTTWLEPDGRAKYEYRASIMSDREFELIGSLPESIRLETVHLGPTTLPPSLQIAVPPGNSVLRLTYYDEANRWQFLGIHQVSLPTWQDAPLPGLCRHRVILSSGQALAYPPAKDTRNSLQNWLRGWSDEAGPELARVLSRNATLEGEEVPDTGTLASRVRIVDQSDSIGLTLIVIPRWVLHGMGMALMVGLTGLAWRLRKGRWWTMAGAVLVCLILLFALPSDLTVLGWWMLIGCLPAGFLILRTSPKARTDFQRMIPLAAGSVALCFLLRPELAPVLPAQEGPRTGPHLVFVLREERGVGEAERLLVPYPLLQKLRSLASAGVDPLLAPGGAAPLMLSADYVGQVDESFARFSVIYDVHWPGQKPGEWVVPLSGVRLQEASVDGTVAEVHWEKDRGWVVPLSGAGSHRVEMKFQVPVTAERGFGELRFGIPAIAASRCRIGLPGGLVEPRLHGIRGRQLLISDNSGRWLEADLGRTTEINLKWLDGNTAESPGDLRQAYLFELSPHEWKVRGWVHPVAGRVRLPWPQAWHLQAVTPATSRWQLEEDGAKRWLVVEGSRPFQVEASVRPWADDAGLLHLPLPDVASGSRLIGCRISGFSVEKIIQPRRLTEGDEAARLWPTELGNRPDFLLLAEGKQPAELVLRLRPERTGAEVTPTYRLRPEATGAEVQVRLDCRVRRGGPAFMTFDLPEDWLVADVQGSDLSRWTRLGRRLEIWLKHLEGERTQLELRAWIPAVQRDGQSLLSLKPLLAGSFEAAPNNSAPGALSSTTSPGGDRQRGETALGLGRLEVLPGEADLRLTPSRLDGVSEAGDGYRLDRPDFLAVWRLDRER